MPTSRGGVRLNADVDVETAKRLKHLLVDEGTTFSDWMRRQIDAYLAAKEPKQKRRKGKEG
jgi:hypothetical protein